MDGTPAVVLDGGTGYIKLGFAGNIEVRHSIMTWLTTHKSWAIGSAWSWLAM